MKGGDPKHGETDFSIYFISKSEYFKFLSNFFPCEFVNKDGKFSSMEQYFMHAKAMVFDPKSGIANQIMLTDNPGEIKLLGGQIKGYTDKVWNPVKYKIMLHGLRLKFNKNPLRQQLLDTGSKMLFEANKNDFDWGIGCMVDDAVAKEAEVVAVPPPVAGFTVTATVEEVDAVQGAFVALIFTVYTVAVVILLKK